jgi:DNA-directed RNA polymerase specialized sigma24 family protein
VKDRELMVRVASLLGLPAEDAAVAFEVTEHREALAALVCAIDHLPETMQHVLWLEFGENLAPDEVAQVLGVAEERARKLRAEAVEIVAEPLAATAALKAAA